MKYENYKEAEKIISEIEVKRDEADFSKNVIIIESSSQSPEAFLLNLIYQLKMENSLLKEKLENYEKRTSIKDMEKV
jgi:hypothetical protein